MVPQQRKLRKFNWTQFCCWREYFSWGGNLFRGKNQPLVPKMECHHHLGNRTPIFHLPLRLVSRCSLAVPRSQSVRGWLVRPAEFYSDKGTTGSSSSSVPSLFPVWQRADALLQSMFTPSPSSSVCSVVPSAQVVTVELLVWPTGSWHVRVQDSKDLDLLNSSLSLSTELLERW